MTISHALQTGLIVGRFGVGIADGPDTDGEPDIIPASGKITFTAMIPYTQNPESSPAPLTVLRVPIIALLDGEGYLCTPDHSNPNLAGARGIRLFATNDPGASVTDWTYRVEYDFNRVGVTKPSIEMHNIQVLADQTGDLSKMAPVPGSQGYGVAHAEASAQRAEESAQRAEASARSTLEEALAIRHLVEELSGHHGLEVDRSVGVRVTLPDADEPVSLLSTTGVRDITAEWDGGEAATLPYSSARLFREGSSVTLVLDSVGDSGARSLRYVLPTGFMPSTQVLATTSAYIRSDLRPVTAQFSGGGIYMLYGEGGPVPPDVVVVGQLTWHTSDPWPTELPGVAA